MSHSKFVLVIYFMYYCCWSVANSCPTLCDPMGCSPPGSYVFHSWNLFKFVATELLMLTISSSAAPFSFCLQSFPMSLFFTSGGQSIGDSASESVLPMNIQGWFPLGLTGLISSQSTGPSRGFSNCTIWKHQFFGVLPSLWFNSCIHTRLLEKP